MSSLWLIPVAIVVLLLFAGCRDSDPGVGAHARRDAIVASYLREGWIFRGQIANDLVFAYPVEGGYIVRYISWITPNTFQERFEPTPVSPW